LKTVLKGIKPHLKGMLPKPVLNHMYAYLARRFDASFEGQPSAKVFSAVYDQGKWGKTSDGDFYSGSGSHKPDLVLPYVNSTAAFLRSLEEQPSVVDLGCGDFNIGRQLRPYCGRYIACDVVPQLIERNAARFCDQDVEFRCLDIAKDPLPQADVACLRQVLQHLDNDNIQAIVRQLSQYRFVIVTEHLPSGDSFIPNKDKKTGCMIRLLSDSGVVLTAAPFNLKIKSSAVLCTIPQELSRRPGVIKTILYEL
jgi:SAM-dependent methyltransferase